MKKNRKQFLLKSMNVYNWLIINFRNFKYDHFKYEFIKKFHNFNVFFKGTYNIVKNEIKRIKKG